MFNVADNHHNLSLRLSEVLSDVGVNEKMVMDRRKMQLLGESVENIGQNLNGICSKIHFLGSQVEGTTTLGLRSDTDRLIEPIVPKVIQEISEQNAFVLQFMMLQDETTAPGYCLLQWPDWIGHCPWLHFPSGYVTIDNRRRVLHKNTTMFLGPNLFPEECYRRGPSTSIYSLTSEPDNDVVFAFACSTWPKEARPWLQKQSPSGWPSSAVKSTSAEKGCSVVPVSSKTGVYPDQEWRISTSYAERCLMFTLSITQIRCYILMKMIIKNYIKPECEDIISSYMCKNILFYSIAASRTSFWKENNLVACLNQCLQGLLHCILSENCPHFIIPNNNLLQGKLTYETQLLLADILCRLTGNIKQTLLGISTDNLGDRLGFSNIIPGLLLPFNYAEPLITSMRLNATVSNLLHIYLSVTQQKISRYSVTNFCENISQQLFRLSEIYSKGNWPNRTACKLYAPFFCTIFGSALASVDIQHSRHLSNDSLRWLSLGLNSDCASNKLKVASALYCAGDIGKCEVILGALGTELDHSTFQNFFYCSCDHASTVALNFDGLCCVRREKIIRSIFDRTVRFLPFEIHCIPKELAFEIFGSTRDGMHCRDLTYDWMDFPAVDFAPFLFFLQYKIYRQTHRPADQLVALENLSRTTEMDHILLHRDKAYNLLGQCLEQENRKQEALYCYLSSLKLRPTNSAARWHICRLLAQHFQTKHNCTPG